ncbi:CvpA family protein [Chitinibacteraceae bacterium HSL-7]
MTPFDYAVLVILGYSVVLAVMRGFVKELTALLVWAGAAWLSFHYAERVQTWLPSGIPNDQLRYLAATIAIFFCVWVLATIVRLTLGQLFMSSELRVLDRLAGAVFGLARGVLALVFLVLAAGLTAAPKQPLWRNAMFSPALEALAQASLPLLPPELARQIRFD